MRKVFLVLLVLLVVALLLVTSPASPLTLRPGSGPAHASHCSEAGFASARIGNYSVVGSPSISVCLLNEVLSRYHSPAASLGQALYNLGEKYGIDPVFALAFFLHESRFGTRGEARLSLSLGNLRCIPNFKCLDGYAWFSSWKDGFEAWYKLIRNLYVTVWGLITIKQIIPRYAPSADNNNEAAYIAAVERGVDTWRIVEHHNAVVPLRVLSLDSGTEYAPGKAAAVERPDAKRRNSEEMRLLVSKLLLGLDSAKEELEKMPKRTRQRYLQRCAMYLKPRIGRPWAS